MPSRFAAVTNKEISQLIKQAVPEIHEEGVLATSTSVNSCYDIKQYWFNLLTFDNTTARNDRIW